MTKIKECLFHSLFSPKLRTFKIFLSFWTSIFPSLKRVYIFFLRSKDTSVSKGPFFFAQWIDIALIGSKLEDHDDSGSLH